MSDLTADPTPGDSLPSEPERSAGAPQLPIQAPAVRAALALERLKGQCDLALFHLEHQPDQPEPINTALNGAVGQINAAIAAVQHLQELRSCKGQG